MKRQPIKKRIRSIMLWIALITIIVMSIITFIFMFLMRRRTSGAVVRQLQDNTAYIMADKVELAEKELNKLIGYLESNSYFLGMIYENPNNYTYKPVGQIDTSIVDEYSLQRTILSKNINLDSIDDEMGRVSSVLSMWEPLMKVEGKTIASIYLGTESGFMFSYDKFASQVELSDDGELYFNYKERPWYINAKEQQKTVLGDVEQDYFGRGLTFTCSTPFYNNGKLVGVIAMDILVSDLQDTIINIDYDSSSTDDYAFIVGSNGDILATPYIDKNSKVFENIHDSKNQYYSISDKLLSETAGVEYINNSFCAHDKIDIVDWYLCMYIPETLVLKEVNNIDNAIQRMIKAFLIILIVLIVLIVQLSKNVSKKITEPILQLNDDVERISKGDLDYKARTIGNDEVTDLATSFNNMTTSLKNYISDLTNLTAEKERIGAELNVATHIQAAMLPSLFPAFPRDERFDIYATMNPAKEVGGDFYDFFKLDDKHLAMVVADVSGKGVPAALFMVIGKTLIKDHTALKRNLNETFYDVNNILCESNSEELFITAFEAVINVETGHVTYVNAGHEMPFIYKNGIWKPEKIKPSFVLAGMENMKFSGGELFLEKGNILFEYTDGATEATNSNNELYGMDRLEKALTMNTELPMEKLLPAIKDDIDKFVGEAPQFVDITMLGFKLL